MDDFRYNCIRNQKKEVSVKMKKLSVLLSGLALLLLMSVCPGCQKEFEIEVTMINGSSSDVHLWITGESIDPSNKLAPGKLRNYVWDVKDTENFPEITFTIYAGQNGQTLTSKQFVLPNATGSLTVKYVGGSLVKQ